jgi:hypothetical protein
MWRKNLIFFIAISLLLFFVYLFYTGEKNNVGLATGLIASGIFLLIIYNFENVKKLGLTKSGVLIEMKKIQKDIYAKKEQIEEVRKEIKRLIELIAEPLSFSTNMVGRLPDENTFEFDVKRQREIINKALKLVREEKQGKKEKD